MLRMIPWLASVDDIVKMLRRFILLVARQTRGEGLLKRKLNSVERGFLNYNDVTWTDPPDISSEKD